MVTCDFVDFLCQTKDAATSTERKTVKQQRRRSASVALAARCSVTEQKSWTKQNWAKIAKMINWVKYTPLFIHFQKGLKVSKASKTKFEIPEILRIRIGQFWSILSFLECRIWIIFLFLILTNFSIFWSISWFWPIPSFWSISWFRDFDHFDQFIDFDQFHHFDSNLN